MNETDYIVKQVMKLYDMTSDSSVKNVELYDGSTLFTVRVNFTFTPKEISTITPQVVECKAVFKYDPVSGNRDFWDFIHLDEDEMPILKYAQGEFEFNTYLKELARDKFYELIKELPTKE